MQQSSDKRSASATGSSALEPAPVSDDDSFMYSASLYLQQSSVMSSPMPPDNASEVSTKTSTASRAHLRREAGRLNLNRPEPPPSAHQVQPYTKTSNSFLTRVRDSFRKCRRMQGGSSGGADGRITSSYRLSPSRVSKTFEPALEINDEEEDTVITDKDGNRKK